jgi:hypothetical protein
MPSVPSQNLPSAPSQAAHPVSVNPVTVGAVYPRTPDVSAAHHSGKWSVRVGELPEKIVDASNRKEAWAAYRTLMGIVTSEWPPEIIELPKAV